MFENYIFTKDSCKNVVENQKIIGFELETLISYYRGIPLSMVYSVELTLDGLPVPKGILRVSLDRELWFTLSEIETVTSMKWEYGEPLHVRALIEGGLRPGEHDVKLAISVWPSYYPFPAGGEATRIVSV